MDLLERRTLDVSAEEWAILDSTTLGILVF